MDFLWTWAPLFFVIVIQGTHAQNVQDGRRQGRARQARLLGRGLPPFLQSAYESQVPGANARNPFTPTLPTPEQVDCYVEVQMIHLQGGVCTQLGGEHSRPYICQSGQHIGFEPTCGPILQQREAQRLLLQQQQQQPEDQSVQQPQQQQQEQQPQQQQQYVEQPITETHVQTK